MFYWKKKEKRRSRVWATKKAIATWCFKIHNFFLFSKCEMLLLDNFWWKFVKYIFEEGVKISHKKWLRMLSNSRMLLYFRGASFNLILMNSPIKMIKLSLLLYDVWCASKSFHILFQDCPAHLRRLRKIICTI